MIITYKILFEKYFGKRSLGRRMHRWDDNIKMVLEETVVVMCTGFM